MSRYGYGCDEYMYPRTLPFLRQRTRTDHDAMLEMKYNFDMSRCKDHDVNVDTCSSIH